MNNQTTKSLFFIYFIYGLIGINAQTINDPRLKRAIQQSGIDKKTISNIISKNEISNNVDSPSIQTNNQSLKNDSEYLQKIEKLDKSNNENDVNIAKADSSKNDLNPETLQKIRDKKSSDVEEMLTNIENNENYFGYNIFKSNPELFQNSIDVSVDPNYVIGPGDEVIIMLWGETELNQSYYVTKDGYLFIPNVGQVFVNGLNLEKLEKKLLRYLKKVYSSLDAGNGIAKTFFDVSLGSLSLKPVRIFVLGDVLNPGAYKVKSSTTLFSSLFYFGGPSITGSLRNIKLIRKGKQKADIDFYDFLLNGKKPKDFQLQREDIIFIPQRNKTVTVSGEIHRNKIFELKDEEGFLDLMNMAGGIKSTTYTRRAQINRILPSNQRKEKGIDKTKIDVDINNILLGKNDIELFDGDAIVFFPIIGKEGNIVQITGAVKRPGSYDLKNGLSFIDLLDKADGLSPTAYLSRAVLIRTNDNNTLDQTYIDINIELAMKNDLDHNIELKSGDQIQILDFKSMRFTDVVSITGHVENPGPVQFRKGMRVIDLVFTGGGFENDQHLSNTYFDKAELYQKNENGDVTDIIAFRLDSVLMGKGIAERQLKMGDEIQIYSIDKIREVLPTDVKIRGFVKRPGTYPIVEGITTIRDLLFRAGGFQDKIHLNKLYNNRADLIRFENDLYNKEILKFRMTDILDTNKNINPILKRGDEIVTYSVDIIQEENFVTILGDVINPGSYKLKTNMVISDLILESGGVPPNIRNYKVEIASIDEKSVNNFSKIRTYYYENNLNTYKVKDSFQKSVDVTKLLSPNDIVTVIKDPSTFESKSITILGSVQYPGTYIIKHRNELVTDIIERAGGITIDAYPLASTFSRNNKNVKLSFKEIIRNPRSRKNFSVQNGDSITIGKKTNIVVVGGAVNSPGNFQYIKGHRLNDYIAMAGGFTTEARRSATYTSNLDGSSKKVSYFSLGSPKILDGATITVPTKLEVEPFNITEYVTNLTQIYSDLTQAYLLITLAKRE